MGDDVTMSTTHDTRFAHDPRLVDAKTGRSAAPAHIVRTRAHRRPSGEPPPLPHHLDTTGKGWLAALVFLPVFWAFLATRIGRTTIDVFDHQVAQAFAHLHSPGLTHVALDLNSLGSQWTYRLLFWSVLVVCVVFRRFRHLLVFIGAVVIVATVTAAVEVWFDRPRPLGVELLGPWTDFAHPSRNAAAITGGSLGVLYTVVPQGRLRQIGKWLAAALVTVFVLDRLYLGVDGFTDLLAGAVLGVAVPLVAFRVLVPNEAFPIRYRRGRTAHLDVGGERGRAIRTALEDQLGLVVTDVHPFGLLGSAGSTPLRVTVKGDPDTYLFAKLYAATHLRSDRWYKFARSLLYGRLEAEARFTTVRHMVQYEDYTVRLVKAAGISGPEPYGIVEITPEREYLVVTQFFDGAIELGEASVDTSIIDQGLHIVRQLWEAGLAHRDIKPSNLLVHDGRLCLIDPAFTEVRPTPWRQAVDLANMMLTLALYSSPLQVYERAINFFTFEEITEAFAATRGLTMPSQIRHIMRERGRDLHREFTDILPPYRRIAIQRWSVRRVAVLIAVVVGAVGGGVFGVSALLSMGNVS